MSPSGSASDSRVDDDFPKLDERLRMQRMWFQAKGREEGRVFAAARAVLTVLDARGITLSADQKTRILACTDLEVLEHWIQKAVTVASADELFTE